MDFKPKGYHSVAPYVIVEGAAEFIQFLQNVFGAEKTETTFREDGAIRHAEVLIGDSHIMISDASAQYPALACMLYVYVPNTDEVYRRAVAAGAVSIMEPADQFYGDRNAGVKDKWGLTWWIATHVEDVSVEDIQQRASARAS